MTRPPSHTLTLAALAALAVSAAQAAPACGPVTPLIASPTQSVAAMPPNPAGCIEGSATPLRDGSTVWRCARDIPADSDAHDNLATHALVVMRGTESVFHSPDTAPVGDGSGLHVLSVDLSGDGLPETLIATHNTTSQGLGVHRWTLNVFDAAWTHLGLAPEVADWGPSAFLPHPSGPGCAALITSYRLMEMPNGTEATWLTGQRATVSGASFIIEEAPVAERRLDNTLNRLRTRATARTKGPERTPDVWLRGYGVKD